MSLRAFFLNWLGVNVSEDQLLNIQHPRFEVQWYTTMKCMQLGAVLGYAYAMRIPIMRYLGRPVPPSLSRVDTIRAVLRTTRTGMMGGLVASFPAAVAYAYQHQLTDASYYKRALELRHNRKQLNMDRASVLFGLASGAYYNSILGMPLSMGFAPGMALGSIGVALYNNADRLYRKDKLTQKEKHTLNKLSDKVQEQAESAKDSFLKVAQEAQERTGDAKDSFKQVAVDTKDVIKKVSEEGKDAIKKVSEEGKDSIKKVAHSAQDYVIELERRVKNTVNKEHKKMEHRD